MGSLFGKWATSCVVHQPVVELGLAGTINARRTAGGVGTSPTEKPVCLTGSGDRPLLGPVGAAESVSTSSQRALVRQTYLS